MVGGLVMFAGLFVALMVGVGGLLFGLLTLPFRLLGLLAKGIGFLVALPFLLVGAVFVGLGALVLALTPLLPFVLIGLGIWWLVRRKPHSNARVA